MFTRRAGVVCRSGVVWLVTLGCAEPASQLALALPICSADAGLSYASSAKPFLEKYCIECHSQAKPAKQRQGAPLDHNFDSEAATRDVHSEHVIEVIATDDADERMPPEGQPQPTTAERQQFLEWLACAKQ